MVLHRTVYAGPSGPGPSAGATEAHDPDGGAPADHHPQLRQDRRAQRGRGAGAGHARRTSVFQRLVLHVRIGVQYPFLYSIEWARIQHCKDNFLKSTLCTFPQLRLLCSMVCSGLPGTSRKLLEVSVAYYLIRKKSDPLQLFDVPTRKCNPKRVGPSSLVLSFATGSTLHGTCSLSAKPLPLAYTFSELLRSFATD